MKKYIAPAILVVDVHIESIMMDASKIVGVSSETATSEEDFAAPTYRSSLWTED